MTLQQIIRMAHLPAVQIAFIAKTGFLSGILIVLAIGGWSIYEVGNNAIQINFTLQNRCGEDVLVQQFYGDAYAPDGRHIAFFNLTEPVTVLAYSEENASVRVNWLILWQERIALWMTCEDNLARGRIDVFRIDYTVHLASPDPSNLWQVYNSKTIYVTYIALKTFINAPLQ